MSDRNQIAHIGVEELAALRRDAERYRWIKNGGAAVAAQWPDSSYESPSAWDAAIDAAIDAERKGVKE